MDIDLSVAFEGLTTCCTLEHGVEATEDDVSKPFFLQITEHLRRVLELLALVANQLENSVERLRVEHRGLLSLPRGWHYGRDLGPHFHGRRDNGGYVGLLDERDSELG